MAGGMNAYELVEDFAARLVPAERMDGKRNIEPLRFFIQRIELSAGEVSAVRLGGEHASNQIKLGDRAPKFPRRFFRTVDRQVRHRFKPLRTFAVVGNEVVVGAAQSYSVGPFFDLSYAQTGGRVEHRCVNFLAVHRRQSLFELYPRLT